MCRLFCVHWRMCILLLLGRMFCMSVRSFRSITSLKFAFSLLIFYLDHPYIFEILVLKSIIVLFFSFQICQCLLYIFRFFGVENIYIHNCYIFLLNQLSAESTIPLCSQSNGSALPVPKRISFQSHGHSHISFMHLLKCLFFREHFSIECNYHESPCKTPCSFNLLSLVFLHRTYIPVTLFANLKYYVIFQNYNVLYYAIYIICFTLSIEI